MFRQPQRQKEDFQTDAIRPTALPSASLTSAHALDESPADQTSDEYLNGVYEDWNKKVDAEIETLVDGMTDLVQIASIGNKDKFRVAQEAFQAQCRTESMVRAATSLLAITHSLKLLLLLSDEAEIVKRRDAASEQYAKEVEDAREEATRLLSTLLGRSDSQDKS